MEFPLTVEKRMKVRVFVFGDSLNKNIPRKK